MTLEKKERKKKKSSEYFENSYYASYCPDRESDVIKINISSRNRP